MSDLIPIDRIKRSQRADVVARLQAAGATDEQIAIFMKDKKITQDEINAIKKENAEVTTHTTNELIMNEKTPLDAGQLDYLVKVGVVQKNGNSYILMNGKTLENVQAALQEYANNNVEKPTATFSEDSSDKIIKPMTEGEAPVLTPNPKAGERVYTVNNEAGLKRGLDIPDDAEIEKKPETVEKEFNLKVKTTTVTNKNYGAPDEATMRAQDLENSSVRKECKQQFRNSLIRFLAESPENYDMMNDSLIGKKYRKQFTKAQAKFKKQYINNEEGMVRDFFDGKIKGAMPDEADIKKFKESQNNIEEALKAYRDGKATPEQKELAEGARDAYLKANNTNIENILYNDNIISNVATRYTISSIKGQGVDLIKHISAQAAKEKVLAARTPEEVAYDTEYYLDYMSEREVQKYRDENRVANTVAHFSKDEYKAAKKAEKDSRVNHTYIGKYGIKMVESAPELFCDTLEKRNDKYFLGDKEVKPDFEQNGNAYLFNSKKYSDKIGEFIDNAKTDKDAGNAHATLSEIRTMAGQEGANRIFYNSEEERFDTLEGLYGNSNTNVGYWEGKRTRNIVESTGRSVDKDESNLMIAGSVAGKSALTFAMAFVPGALAAKGFKEVVDVAGHVIQIPTQTFTAGNHTIEVPGVPYKGKVTNTDYINGIEGTHNTPYSGIADPTEIIVDGQPASLVDGKYTVKGETYTLKNEISVDGKKMTDNGDGTVTIDGKKMKVSEKPDWFKQGLKTGLYATLLALPANVLSSLGIKDLGDTDDVVRLDSSKSEVSEQEGRFKVKQQYETYNLECKKEETAGFKPCKLRVNHVSDNLNRGETMESMVAKYYGVQLGSEDYNKIYNYVQQFNELRNFGGTHYPTKNIINLPDFIPANITGNRVDRVADPSNPEQRLRLDTQDIPLANKAVKTETAKSKAGGEAYSASCNVRKQKRV